MKKLIRTSQGLLGVIVCVPVTELVSASKLHCELKVWPHCIYYSIYIPYIYNITLYQSQRSLYIQLFSYLIRQISTAQSLSDYLRFWSFVCYVCKFHNCWPLENVNLSVQNTWKSNKRRKKQSYPLLSCHVGALAGMHFAASSFINCPGELFSLYLRYTTLHPLTPTHTHTYAH